MDLNLDMIVKLTGGVLKGRPPGEITGVAPLGSAGPADLSFVQGRANFESARASRAGAVLCAEDLPWFAGARVIVKDPRTALAAVLDQFEKDLFHREAGAAGGAIVDPGARIGAEVFIGHGAVIEEGAELGDGCRIHANAVVSRGSTVGAGTVIHSGAVVGQGVRIGSRCVIGPNCAIGFGGFGVSRGEDGALRSIPQVGTVIVDDDVEIGAMCTVDRGTLGATAIGSGTRMDTHCHVAHNARIGRNCLLVAYARIAGSTVLEDGVTVAEDVGITDNVTVGAGARIGGGSKVYRSVSAGEEVWGSPARPLALERKVQAALNRLPELREKVRVLWRTFTGNANGR